MKAVARKVCDNAKEILDDVLSQQPPLQAESLQSSPTSPSNKAASVGGGSGSGGGRDVTAAWNIMHTDWQVKGDIAALDR